jgi:TPR repeat protein
MNEYVKKLFLSNCLKLKVKSIKMSNSKSNYHIYASASPRGDSSFLRQISDSNETDDRSYLFSDAKILIDIVLKEVISLKEKMSKISITLGEQLIQKLEEIILEFEGMGDKICIAINSSEKVSEHIISLSSTLQDIIKYFQKLKIKNITIFNKKKYKLIMLNLIQELRSHSTKLMSDVTLELLLHKSNNEISNNKIELNKEKSEDTNYAYAFFYGIYGQVQNFNIAFTLFSKAVENNDSDTDSMLKLSECYENGYGVDKNMSNSQYWLQKSVNKCNNSIAKNKLAMMILDKYGQKNINLLKRILKDKISNGVNEMTLNNTFDYDDISLINNTTMDIDNDDIENNDKEIEYAMKLLLEAAQDGIAISQTNLGITYEFIGDFDQAAKWYGVAALDGGCNLATNKFGKLYLLGHGVEKNPAKAFSMFKIAAKSGNIDSHYNIG